MAPFFSKKQKTEFRKRKRRQKHAAPSEAGQNSPSTKKDEPSSEEKDQTTIGKPDSANNGTTNEFLVSIPKELSTQEARKFRKEARRKARAEGKDESLLQFVVEGSEPITMPEEENNRPKKKKRKRDFPCLNDLVKEEIKAKQQQQLEQQRKEQEEALTADYKSRYLALDCEMVGIGTDGKKSALARVSIVDWEGKTILDRFVQVPVHVADFRTHVSGVTAKNIHRDSGAMKVKECQETVAKLLSGKVLVGHALRNDLHALMLTHPKADIRDTARYRPYQRLGGMKWRPRKLKDLAKENLDLDIQVKGQSHDSVDDARAAMQLFRLARDEWETSLAEKKQRK